MIRCYRVRQQDAEKNIPKAFANFSPITPEAFANFSPITPEAFANFSPGLERQRQPWVGHLTLATNPERVRQSPNPFRVNASFFIRAPRVLAVLEPWAEISERLRRNFKLTQFPFCASLLTSQKSEEQT